MSKPKPPKKLTKEERLAEQLRANLRRRKAAVKRQKASAAIDSGFDENSNQKNTPSSS